jgi:hypothetical protein
MEYNTLKSSLLAAFTAEFPIFSRPDDGNNFDNTCISDSGVSYAYLSFVGSSREFESIKLCKSFTGKIFLSIPINCSHISLGEALTFDQTFSVASKAKVVTSSLSYAKPMNNQLEIMNERSQILSWVSGIN